MKKRALSNYKKSNEADRDFRLGMSLIPSTALWVGGVFLPLVATEINLPWPIAVLLWPVIVCAGFVSEFQWED